MLSQAEMVRKAIEKQYKGTCTITEHQKFKKPNKSTGFEDVIVLQNQPCKLSFEKIASTAVEHNAPSITQVIKLFLAPEIEVKPGSKITVTQNGNSTDYKGSGKPAIFTNHQEIILELFDGWA